MHCLFQALKVVQKFLNPNEPRHLDYVLAVNLLGAFILTKIGRFEYALDFVKAAESALASIIEYNLFDKTHPVIEAFNNKKIALENEFIN